MFLPPFPLKINALFTLHLFYTYLTLNWWYSMNHVFPNIASKGVSYRHLDMTLAIILRDLATRKRANINHGL